MVILESSGHLFISYYNIKLINNYKNLIPTTDNYLAQKLFNIICVLDSLIYENKLNQIRVVRNAFRNSIISR